MTKGKDRYYSKEVLKIYVYIRGEYRIISGHGRMLIFLQRIQLEIKYINGEESCRIPPREFINHVRFREGFYIRTRTQTFGDEKCCVSKHVAFP